MKVKILLLALLCFLVFGYCESPADPEIKKVLNPIGPPVINHFTATHQQSTWQGYEQWNSYFILSWNVTNATTVSIDQGIGGVSAIGTKEVQISKTTTYTLSATNKNGQITASCVAERPKNAILEISTIPEVPVLHYYSDPAFDNSQGWVTIVITETNGVGGYVHCTIGYDSGNCGWAPPKQTFEPFGNASILYAACANGRPTTMTIWLTGWDNNNCEINIQFHIPVIVEN